MRFDLHRGRRELVEQRGLPEQSCLHKSISINWVLWTPRTERMESPWLWRSLFYRSHLSQPGRPIWSHQKEMFSGQVLWKPCDQWWWWLGWLMMLQHKQLLFWMRESGVQYTCLSSLFSFAWESYVSFCLSMMLVTEWLYVVLTHAPRSWSRLHPSSLALGLLVSSWMLRYLIWKVFEREIWRIRNQTKKQ